MDVRTCPGNTFVFTVRTSKLFIILLHVHHIGMSSKVHCTHHSFALDVTTPDGHGLLTVKPKQIALILSHHYKYIDTPAEKRRVSSSVTGLRKVLTVGLAWPHHMPTISKFLR